MPSIHTDALNRFKAAKKRLAETQARLDVARADHERAPTATTQAALTKAEAEAKAALYAFNDASMAAHKLFD